MIMIQNSAHSLRKNETLDQMS